MTDDVVWFGPDALRPLLAPVDTLRLDPQNARAHPPKNLDAIRGSLASYGQQKPIVATPDGVIVAGNGLWMALRQGPVPEFDQHGNVVGEHAWTHVAVVPSDLSPAELVGYGLADNRSGELAEWDLDVLSSHLGGLQQDGVDLALLGWDDDDLARLLGDVEPPEGFAELDEDIETEHRCPKCGYEWSGATS